MKSLKALKHPNIANFYGAIRKSSDFYTVTGYLNYTNNNGRGSILILILLHAEYCQDGSLYDYLHVKKKQPQLKEKQCLLWANQIARGM